MSSAGSVEDCRASRSRGFKGSKKDGAVVIEELLEELVAELDNGDAVRSIMAHISDHDRVGVVDSETPSPN